MARLTIVLFSFFLILSELCAEPVRGRWKCVALGPSALALTGDYTDAQEELFRQRFAERRKTAGSRMPRWAADLCFQLAGTEAIARYRPEIVSLLRDRPSVKLVSQSSAVPLSAAGTGYWLNPVGQSRFPDENGRGNTLPCTTPFKI